MLPSPLPARYSMFVSTSKKGRITPLAWSSESAATGLRRLRRSHILHSRCDARLKPVVTIRGVSPSHVIFVAFVPSWGLHSQITRFSRGSKMRFILSFVETQNREPL